MDPGSLSYALLRALATLAVHEHHRHGSAVRARSVAGTLDRCAHVADVLHEINNSFGPGMLASANCVVEVVSEAVTLWRNTAVQLTVATRSRLPSPTVFILAYPGTFDALKSLVATERSMAN